MARNGTKSSSTVAVAGHAHVLVHHERQPGQIVREARAHAAPGMRMPPVLHVAFQELPAPPRAGCVRAPAPAPRTRTPSRPAADHENRTRRCSDRGRCAPTAAAERLIQRPLVDHGVEGGIRCAAREITLSRSFQAPMQPPIACRADAGVLRRVMVRRASRSEPRRAEQDDHVARSHPGPGPAASAGPRTDRAHCRSRRPGCRDAAPRDRRGLRCRPMKVRRSAE